MPIKLNITDLPADEDIAWKGDKDDSLQVRLRGALLDANRRLDELKHKKGVGDSHFLAARRCLWQAVHEADRCAWFVAWDCLSQFNDELLAAMDDAEREAFWCTLRAEAESKLKDSWRLTASECLIKQVIKQIDAKKPVPSLPARHVQNHVVTTAQNLQYKLLLLEQTLPSVVGFLLLVVLVAFALATISELWGGPLSEALAKSLKVGMAAGALGGLVSMAFSLGKTDLKARIPDLRFSRTVTKMRPLLGAVVAIPVIVLVESGFVKLTGITEPWSVFAFCFVAGFSERWFLTTMERFEAAKK